MRVDRDFAGVLAACADRPETWINRQIVRLYRDLHRLGHAHSVEIWADGALVGGLYGVAVGAAFFGESMFSRRRDASKLALIALVARLHSGGFRLLDTQFVTDHLARLGAVEIGAPPTTGCSSRQSAGGLPAAPGRHRPGGAARARPARGLSRAQPLPQLSTQTS